MSRRKQNLRTFRMDDAEWSAVKVIHKSLGTKMSLAAIIRAGLKRELKRMRDVKKGLVGVRAIVEETMEMLNGR